MEDFIIRGAGGGGGGKAGSSGGGSTPETAKDNLNSKTWARVLDLIGEGEIEGFATPSKLLLTRDTAAYNTALLKDIYLDNTPLLREQADINNTQRNDFNFKEVEVIPRYGTQSQDWILGYRAVSNEKSVGVLVENGTPITRTITNTNVDAVNITLNFPALQEYQEDGDIVGKSVNIRILVQYNGGGYVIALEDTIRGRTPDLYQREYRINFLVNGPKPIDVRVARVSADNPQGAIQDVFTWSNYTEITYAKLRYPNSALVGIQVNAEQFNNVPSRMYRIRGLKVRIPSNATPGYQTGRLRYSEDVWDGTFQAAAWTSDPAWCLYDLLTSKRYGFGNYISELQLDKWSFYSASQYCSELVPDGFGGEEPRFSCNVNIQTQEEAYKLINELCSVMRAMPFWSTGALTISQDRPQDNAFIFNSSNVTEDGFTYSGSSLKTRHTVAVVAYMDMESRDTAYEAVEDPDGIARYGVITTEIRAFACTSRGQARRIGEWLLYSEQNETEVVNFVASIDAGMIVRPGQVIRINDPMRAGERRSGRILSATTTQIVADSVADMTAALSQSPTLSVVLPNGSFEVRNVVSFTGNTFTVSPAFSAAPNPNSVWFYQDLTLRPALWRVLSVQEQDQCQYAVTALAYNPTKFTYIERDAPLEKRDASNLNVLPEAPTGLTVQEALYESNGQVLSKLVVSWQAAAYALQYQFRYRYDNNNWVSINTKSFDYEIFNSNPGLYEFEVYGINAALKPGASATLTFNALGKTAPPQTIPDLFIAPIDERTAELYWPQSVDLDVRVGGQIRIRHTPDIGVNASWSGSNDIVPAVAGSSTRKIVPLLEGTYFIRAVDSLGNESAGVASVVVDLPAPQDTFLIVEFREENLSPAFSGTVIDMAYSTDEMGLILANTTQVDDLALDGNWDAIGLIDYIGGTVTSGSYQLRDTLDLSGVYDLDLRAILSTRAFQPGNLFDDRTADIDLWSDIDGGDLSGVNAGMFVRTTADNPSGTPTWSSWQPFVNGTARGRAFQFKMEASSSLSSQNIAVEQLGVITEFQRRTESQRNLTSGAATYAVTFPAAFYQTPSIGITAQDMGQGDYFTISSATRNGFSVTFRNSGGSMVSRTFDYQAVGHGREII